MGHVYVQLRDLGSTFYDSSTGTVVAGRAPVKVDMSANIATAIKGGALVELTESSALSVLKSIHESEFAPVVGEPTGKGGASTNKKGSGKKAKEKNSQAKEKNSRGDEKNSQGDEKNSQGDEKNSQGDEKNSRGDEGV